MNLISEIIFLVGNKSDLEQERQISYQQAKRVGFFVFIIFTIKVSKKNIVEEDVSNQI